MRRGETRPDPTGTAEVGTDGNVTATRRLDRGHVAAIIQRVPRGAYGLAMRGIDATTGAPRWRHGRIGDIDGRAVLGLIDDGRLCLHLHDVDDQLARFDLRRQDVPIDVPPRHRQRHGLIIASPNLRLTLAEPLGAGALRILQGSLTAASAGGGATTFTVGAMMPWPPEGATTIETGGETLMALTVETVPQRRFPRLAAAAASLHRGASAMVATILRSDVGRRPPDGDFVLVRARAQGRATP